MPKRRTPGPPHLRLMPPPDQHEPSSLGLEVGDLVVYASHGIGRIEATERGYGSLPERIILLFESGLKVTLPLLRARDALRRLSDEPELKEVQRTLRADVPPVIEPWSRRHRNTQQKLAAGRADGLAEIVRDGLHRERGSSGRPAPSDNELYRQARKLLTAEIAACRGIAPESADAWILEQVSNGQAESECRTR